MPVASMNKKFLTAGIAIYIRILLISFIIFPITACHLSINVNKPVDLVWDKLGKKTNQVIVFLPGLYDVADVFKKEGFFTIARKAGIEADMVAASIHFDHLLEGKLIKRIEKDVFRNLVKSGYKNIWFVGLSLGGLNSLLFYRQYSDEICGVVVLAPYLTGKPLDKEILSAGGIMKWQPRVENKEIFTAVEVFEQQRLWLWLKEQYKNHDLKNIYLGYGKNDTYVAASNFLASLLNENNIMLVEGGHNFKTARKIWKQQLRSRVETGLLQPCK